MPTAHQFRSEFLRTFVERGAYYDCTDPEALDALFLKERVTAYIGFDCTAPSLHVGNLRADHDAAPSAAGRSSPDRGDGRRHDQGRRSVRQGRGAPAASSAEQIEANKQSDPRRPSGIS